MGLDPSRDYLLLPAFLEPGTAGRGAWFLLGHVPRLHRGDPRRCLLSPQGPPQSHPLAPAPRARQNLRAAIGEKPLPRPWLLAEIPGPAGGRLAGGKTG